MNTYNAVTFLVDYAIVKETLNEKIVKTSVCVIPLPVSIFFNKMFFTIFPNSYANFFSIIDPTL